MLSISNEHLLLTR